MAYEFFVVMQKRRDEKVYTDLHKTDKRMYLSKKEAEAASRAMGGLRKHFHVVKMVAVLADDWHNDALAGGFIAKEKSMLDELLDPRVPKTEREHAAAKGIESLRAVNERLQQIIARRKATCERLGLDGVLPSECEASTVDIVKKTLQLANHQHGMSEEQAYCDHEWEFLLVRGCTLTVTERQCIRCNLRQREETVWCDIREEIEDGGCVSR